MVEVLEQQTQPRTVEAVLNYCGKMDFKPLTYAKTNVGHPKRRGEGVQPPEAPAGAKTADPNAGALNPLNVQPHRVSIIDGSSYAAKTDLDREGFVLLHHPSKVTDFKNMDQIEEVYYPEIRALFKSLVGADGVEFPPEAGAYRNTRSTGGNEARAALIVHIDFTESGAFHTVSHELPNRPKNIRRWAYYKVWRALSPVAPVDVPFALLDSQTLEPEDIIPVDTKFEHIEGVTESAVLHYNPDHRWMYFSQMKRDDIIVFKTYDSDASKNFPAAHTAFTDPSVPDDVAGRTSFELRAYVCWYD